MTCLDLHVLQTVPPSCINRDDTGSPKTCWYGGALRARVSSQAWKRAMRMMFPELLPEGSLGVRTKYVVDLIADAIEDLRPELSEEAEPLACAVVRALGLKVSPSDRAGADRGSQVTDYLVFVAQSEIKKLAEVAIGWRDAGADVDKPSLAMRKEASAAFTGNQAVDVALFGRMLADAADLNTDAAAQVAHAVSVDRIKPEHDFFTAMDDCAADDNAGAAMLESTGYNSSTLYRYASVDIESLVAQVGDVDAAAAGLAAFVEAFARSMPTGKINSFANNTYPCCVIALLRDTRPASAVGAFERPVGYSEGSSISLQAEARLGCHLADRAGAFGCEPLRGWCVTVGESAPELDGVGERVDLPTLESELREAVRGMRAGGGE